VPVSRLAQGVFHKRCNEEMGLRDPLYMPYQTVTGKVANEMTVVYHIES